MKIDHATYAEMLERCSCVVTTAGGAGAVKTAYAGLSPTRMLWDIFHLAFRQPKPWDYKAHPGINDNHLDTALQRIGRELSLLD